MTNGLYEQDYFSWSQRQAALLKAGRLNEIDAALLAEEIEDIGKEIRNACFSFVTRILEHMLKLEYSILDGSKPHWRSEVSHFRDELENRLTRSIERQLDLERLYGKAVRAATAALELDDPEFGLRPPTACPWSLAQIRGDDGLE